MTASVLGDVAQGEVAPEQRPLHHDGGQQRAAEHQPDRLGTGAQQRGVPAPQAGGQRGDADERSREPQRHRGGSRSGVHGFLTRSGWRAVKASTRCLKPGKELSSKRYTVKLGYSCATQESALASTKSLQVV